MRVSCPVCGAMFDLIQALEDKEGRQWVAQLAELPPTVIKPLIRYLHLFRPEQRAMRWSRLLKLTAELVPMIKAAQVSRDGIDYAVPATQWADAMDHLVDTPPKTLLLPLKSNGYLLSILAGQAGQAEAAVEREAEERKRQRGRDGASQGPQAVGQILDGGGKSRSGPPPGWKHNALGGKPRD